MKLANIAQNGDNLETLRALRQTIAEAIDRTQSGRDIASLSRQLQIVIEKITELEALEDDDPISAIVGETQKVRGTNGKPVYPDEEEDLFDIFDE